MFFNSDIKKIKSLKQKKFRDEFLLYTIEGIKSVSEAILSDIYNIDSIVLTDKMMQEINQIFPKHLIQNIDFQIVEKHQYESFTQMTTPPYIMAIMRQTSLKPITKMNDDQNIIFILDNIQNPGNLGAIIRTCDWFGIQEIVITPQCTELYNPKVIQASMGSIHKVDFFLLNSAEELEHLRAFEIWKTDIHGTSLLEIDNTKKCAFIIGNESHGVNDSFFATIDNKVTIPKKGNAESLNASIAHAIICSYMSL